MQLSYYSIVINDYPKIGEYLLYHTRTQALVKIDQNLKTMLEYLDSPDNVSQRTQYAGELEELRKMGFIVSSKWEDVANVVKFVAALKYEKLDTCFYATILTTSACNFKCVYCFEESSRENGMMDFKTADAAMNWIKWRVDTAGYHQLHLTFYGGEPLLNEPVLEYIAKAMQAWCKQRGMGFRFLIQTNGYMMTADRVKKYLGMGLDSVRVSLDGVGDDHDRNRPLRSGGGTFATIMQNIKDNIDRILIGISVSYDHRGTEHISRLLDYLETIGILPKLGKFLFSPVHASLGPKGEAANIRHTQCLVNYRDDNMVEAALAINGYLKQKGLPVTKGLPATACPLTTEYGGITIDPAGDLYACNSMVGHPEFSVGNVRQNGFNAKRKEFIVTEIAWKCPLDCKYLPICRGGCRLMAFLEHKRFDMPYCKKDYLDQVASHLIKNEYEALTVK